MTHSHIFLTVFLVFFVSVIGDNSPDIQSITPRIINGNPAQPGQFPWQAALFFQEGAKFWFCSGTIISEVWILTAAHCIKKAQSVMVFTGIIDISATIEPTATTSNFIIHEKFNISTMANDIALIQLPLNLTFDDNVQTIPLSNEVINDGTNITISGWGKTRANDSSISPLLYYVNLVTISNEECQEAYGDSGTILPQMVCAAVNPLPFQSPCYGDSGGPVVVDFTSKPRHAAIASFVSDTGCESGLPSGYTRTAWFLDWIKEKTGI